MERLKNGKIEKWKDGKMEKFKARSASLSFIIYHFSFINQRSLTEQKKRCKY